MADVGAWRPERFARRRAALMMRARIASALRAYFAERDFVEVDTPALQVSPGLEPHLAAFATTLNDGERAERRYLHTSPEFAMKKLLVAGMPRIFQLAHVFRDEIRSATHHPEFTMLEWYRAGEGLSRLIEDCQALLSLCPTLSWQGRDCDPRAPIEIITVAEAFRRHAGIDVLASAPDPRAPAVDMLVAAAHSIGVATRSGDRWDDVFFRVFLERIEPHLGIGRATVLTEYPASMAALARLKPGDPRVAERFELYVCGLELANAFGELTDAAEQRRRFEADIALKRQLTGEAYPMDEDFLAALARGMPEASGIALGFDRLVMLATGAERIEDVLWLPLA